MAELRRLPPASLSPPPMRLFLHLCCAPCSCRILELCRQEGIEVEGFFYNPNIHPYQEFQRRLRAAQVLAEREKLKLTADDSYGLELFLSTVRGSWPERCRSCYELRLRRTAEEAKSRGFAAFSTTLLGSPTQDHESLQQIGRSVADQLGVGWWYRDWRPEHERSMAQARRLSLYRQKYCGCLWSEYERYRPSGGSTASEPRL